MKKNIEIITFDHINAYEYEYGCMIDLRALYQSNFIIYKSDSLFEHF